LTPFVVEPRLDKKASVNFAFGGAGSGQANLTPNGFMVPGLLGQVGLYNTGLAGKKSNGNALYVVWSGANDYLQHMEYDPYKIVGNVETAIRALYATGARDFLVPNLPDLGNTPLIKAQGAGASATFTGFAKTHNALLSARVTALAKALPGSRMVKLDVFARPTRAPSSACSSTRRHASMWTTSASLRPFCTGMCCTPRRRCMG
jgi:phospholipase/lecithinase/hemolysin